MMLALPARIPSLLLCGCVLSLLPNARGWEAQAGAAEPRPADHRPPSWEILADNLPAEEWRSIAEALEAKRHAVAPTKGGGFRAHNPGQRWTTHFDGRGFRTEPDPGEWSWGLELASYGFSGQERTVTEPERVRTEGQRLAYRWDELVEEWYVNDARGLEHGYTIAQRPGPSPANETDLLTFTLSVRGTLRPEVLRDGQGVRFLDEEGVIALTYAGLHVFDADGETLEASFEQEGGRLHLRINESPARYPVTIDPIAQQAILEPTHAGPYDGFGYSVASSGDTVVVGAPGERSNATGVNGDETDDSLQQAGAAYVFVRNGSGWTQQAYLKPSNTDAEFFFAQHVALSGDTVVVGAYGERSNATGVNGDQTDQSLQNAGAAYVFVRNGSSWSQQAYLKASNTDQGDTFGWAVTISGDTLLVGAPYEDSNATGVNGDQSDDSLQSTGAVYVFRRNGTTWSQEAYLKASNSGEEDYFGADASIEGDAVVIGAWGEASSATGVDGDQTDDSKNNAGAAYVFERNGATWTQRAYLKASNPDVEDRFGGVAQISGNTVLIGAPGEASDTEGVNGDQSDNSFAGAGAAYVFSNDGSGWSQEAYLKASNPDAYDYFGRAAAVSGDLIVVGAPNESSAATVVNGNGNDNSLGSAGAAYLFGRNGTNWSQLAYVKSASGLGGSLGFSTTIEDYLMVFGGSGKAYVFDAENAGTPYCFGDPDTGIPCPCGNDNDGSVRGSGCANGVFSSGARLVGTGIASVSNDTLILATTGLEPSNAGLYFQGNNPVNAGYGNPFGDGLRCAGGGVIRLELRFSDATGASTTTVGIASKGGVAPGDTRRYQCRYRTIVNPPCGSGVNDFNLSNGLEITWLP